MDTAFNEINRSLEFKDELIENDLNLGRGSQGAALQLELAKKRMADGVATLTLLLERLSLEAGLVDHGVSVSVAAPSWVVNSFNSIKKSKSF